MTFRSRFRSCPGRASEPSPPHHKFRAFVYGDKLILHSFSLRQSQAPVSIDIAPKDPASTLANASFLSCKAEQPLLLTSSTCCSLASKTGWACSLWSMCRISLLMLLLRDGPLKTFLGVLR